MNIIVLGPPGSGKGTQAKFLSERFDLIHVDMGKFLREVARLDTSLGKEIYHIQNVTKTLVPSRILREVLHLKLNSVPREQGIVFDGVPRNLDQVKYIEEAMEEFGRRIDSVILIKISEKEAVKRISLRRVCENCKEGYILGKDIQGESEPCGKCGGKITQRKDDTEEGVRKRFEVFQEETLPVIEYYRKRGVLEEINGEKTISEIFDRILSSMKKEN